MCSIRPLPIASLPRPLHGAALSQPQVRCPYVQRVHQKYSRDPDQYRHLQPLVVSEVTQGTHRHRESATTALLWLKRYLARTCFVKYQNAPFEPIDSDIYSPLGLPPSMTQA